MSKSKKSHKNRNCKKVARKTAQQNSAQKKQSGAKKKEKQISILKENISLILSFGGFIFSIVNISGKPTISFGLLCSVIVILISSAYGFFSLYRRKRNNPATSKSTYRFRVLLFLVAFLSGIFLFVASLKPSQISKEPIPQEVENTEQQMPSEQQMLSQAELHYNGKQYESLIELYTSETLQENPIVLNNLGYMYSKGIYFAQDSDTAAHYYELASDKGSSDAFHNLISLQLHSCTTFEEVVDVLSAGYYGGDNETFLFLSSILQGKELSDAALTDQMKNSTASDIESFFAADAETQADILSASLGSWQSSTLFSDNVPHGGGNIYEQYISIGSGYVRSGYSSVHMYNYLKSTRTFLYDNLMQEHFTSVIDPN